MTKDPAPTPAALLPVAIYTMSPDYLRALGITIETRPIASVQ